MQQGIFYPFQVFLKNSNNIAFIKVFWKTATLTQQLIPWSAIKSKLNPSFHFAGDKSEPIRITFSFLLLLTFSSSLT
jgi:hypothetical protein